MLDIVVYVISALFASSQAAAVSVLPIWRGKRVIGGTHIGEGGWPWLVHLSGKVPARTFLGFALSHKLFYCGGSVISKDWVLTAAHCFQDEGTGSKLEDPSNWKIRFGNVNRKTSVKDKLKHVLGKLIDKNDWLHSIHGQKLVIHPKYTGQDRWKYDIALIKLDTSLDLEDDEVGVVTLPRSDESDFPKDGQNCIMKGWGCTEQGGGITEVAQQVNLPKVKDRDCASLYAIETRTRLCAGHNLANKGICQGDSGGPLVCQRSDGAWLQAGIASFTSSVRPENVPGAFTRVSYFSDWIKATINAN